MGIFSIFGNKNKDTIVLKIDKNLPIETSVKLWLKPETNLIQIYEYGYLSGDGLIGQHENKLLATHLKNGKAFEAKVIANDKISVKLFEKTRDQLLDEEYLKNEYPKLKTELLNPIKTKTITARLYLNDEIKIEEGEIIFPVFLSDIEAHIKNRILKLDFKNEQNQTIGIKENEPSKIRQILRMHFANKDKIKGRIIGIKDFGQNKEAEIQIDIE